MSEEVNLVQEYQADIKKLKAQIKELEDYKENAIETANNLIVLFEEEQIKNKALEESLKKEKKTVDFYASIAFPLPESMNDNEEINIEMDKQYKRGGKRARIRQRERVK